MKSSAFQLVENSERFFKISFYSVIHYSKKKKIKEPFLLIGPRFK